MKTVYIIGNFGFGNNSLNGQTVRTRTIRDCLLKRKDMNVLITDYSYIYDKGLIKKIETLIGFIYSYLCSKNVVIMPAQGAIKTIIPVLFYLNKVFNKNLLHIVIGGWLPDYISEGL